MKQQISRGALEHLANLAREAGAQAHFDYLDFDDLKTTRSSGPLPDRRRNDRRRTRISSSRKPLIPVFKL